MKGVFALAIAATLLVSCNALEDSTLPPTGQLVVYVNTDATLPLAPGEPITPDDPLPLFDRLRVELFPPGETTPCEGCARDFAPDRRVVGEGRASFGFLPRVGVAGYVARVRLYRSSREAAGPRPRSTIESVVSLPAIAAEGITEVTVVLRVDDLAEPKGTLDAPIAPDPGRAKPGLAGTWHAELRRACTGDPQPGEVCVPGGAFWMGDPLSNAESERLVALSPFFLDGTETTVASFRAANLADPDVDPIPNRAGNPRCNFTAAPSKTDAFPVNCHSLEIAEAYCRKRGARLPSEAEYEYVTGGRRGFLYPWGDAPPACGDAIWGRADDPSLPSQVRPCVPSSGVGSAAVGTTALDKTSFAGGTIVDLAGNLAEWTRDAFAAHGTKCWSTRGPLVDFTCTDGDPGQRAVRGGDWGELEFALVAQSRFSQDALGGSTRIGFRCARAE